MIRYAVVEVKGKQYTVVPGKALQVDLINSDAKNIEAKALLLAEGDQVKIGQPYLDKEIQLAILKEVKNPKIRVFKYHSKANYRKVKGFRARKTEVMLAA